MKVKKLARKMFKACLEHDKEKEKKLWFKALKKSIKHKHTEVIQ
jgi:hypothetical protein